MFQHTVHEKCLALVPNKKQKDNLKICNIIFSLYFSNSYDLYRSMCRLNDLIISFEKSFQRIYAHKYFFLCAIIVTYN